MSDHQSAHPTIDSELPNWVCMPDDGGSHLTIYTHGEISGCKDHPIAGGCSLPQPEFTNLIAQEANKAVVAKLEQWANFFDDPSMDAMTVSDRLRKDAEQLTADKEPKQ